MKNTILFILALAISFSVSASEITPSELVHVETIGATQASLEEPPGDVHGIITEIMEAAGSKMKLEVRAANIPNAAAVAYGGKRFILYNPGFMNQMIRATGTRWTAVSILAHEIGHHIDGHTLSGKGSRPETELEADAFSGSVLRKMGATLAESQAAMKMAASHRSSSTHPGKYDRLAAIAGGWYKADEEITGIRREPETIVRAEKTPENQTGSTTRVDEKFIIGQVRFTADAGSEYFVTSRYNLVKVQNNRVAVIGKVSTLNSRRYPYLIHDSANTQLLVDAYGNIVTKNGRKVGELRKV
jgi:hypothetical protein